jgi:hypothetical protein
MSEEYPEELALMDLPLWSDAAAKEILEEICKKHNVPADVMTDLVALQRERQHQERAHGIFMRFEEILGRMD